MRSHGQPDWPAPTNMGGEFEFNLQAVDVDPTAPQAMARGAEMPVAAAPIRVATAPTLGKAPGRRRRNSWRWVVGQEGFPAWG